MALRIPRDGSPPPVLQTLRRAGRATLGYPNDVREAARRLVEGTASSYAVVAAVIGVGTMSVNRWARAGGWRRPPEARPPGRTGPRGPYRTGSGAEKRRRAAERLVAEADRTPPRPPRSLRSGGQPYRADTVEAVRRLLVDTVVSKREIARRIGIDIRTIEVWMRRRGWERHPSAPTRPAHRSRHERDAAKARARHMVEQTLLPTALIAARVGVHPETVRHWRRREGWRWARREHREERRRELRKSRQRRESVDGYAPGPLKRVRRDRHMDFATSLGQTRVAPSPVPRIRSL